MAKSGDQTKEKILQAALEVFGEYGLKGARTTLIAQKAGISRTMLHYHYSTKEALFQETILEVFKMPLMYFSQEQAKPQNLEEMISVMVDILIGSLEASPHLAGFILNLLKENPQIVLHSPLASKVDIREQLDQFLDQERALNPHSISPKINGIHLLMHIAGLCTSPFLLKPYLLFKENWSEADYNRFIEERKDMVKELIMSGIKIS